jgi:phosphoribosylformylglycinamidine synthase
MDESDEHATLPDKENYDADLRNILAAPNVRSREWIVRQYDHEVQGQTVLKPLVGAENDGPGNGTLIAPVLGSRRGFALACGMNPKYGDIDAYHSAASAIDEAMRNIIAVGGTLDETAILDNFCWGNTRKPEQLGTLVRAALACYDVATDFGVPFISGKDSLNNEFSTEDGTIAIPPTLLISAISVIPDVRQGMSMDLKDVANQIYLVGQTYPELGGSHYYDQYDFIGQTVPQVRVDTARELMEGIVQANRNDLIRSCHDLSEGGLAVAAAEMAFAGNHGLEADLSAMPFQGSGELRRDDVLLFSESNSRFLVEVQPDNCQAFEQQFDQLPVARIGEVTDTANLTITGLEGNATIDQDISSLKSAWQTPLFPGHD